VASRNRFQKLLVDGRNRKALSQHELAYRIGVSTRSVEMWEKGWHLPNPVALKALALELDLDFDELKAERWDERARRRRARERRARKEDAAAGAAA
jgi:transcriptional regulator with XRE-family HTH domain